MNNYQILGLNKGASKEDIKKAYRKLCLIHHPDRGGDSKKFIQIKQAYDDLLEGITGEEKHKVDYRRHTTTEYSYPREDFSCYCNIEGFSFEENGDLRIKVNMKNVFCIWAFNPDKSHDIERFKIRAVNFSGILIIKKKDIKRFKYHIKLTIWFNYVVPLDKEYKIKPPKSKFRKKLDKFLQIFKF